MPEGDRFAQALHQPGDADLVDHLGELAGPAGAQQHKGPCICHGHRGNGVKSSVVAAAHHGQHAVLGAGLAARDRCIDKLQAQLASVCEKLAGDIGRCRCVVHEDGPRPHAGEGPIVAAFAVAQIRSQGDAAQIAIVADATKHDIRAGRGQARRRRVLRPVGGGELLAPGSGFGCGPVVDRHRVACQRQMPGHGKPHDSQAEKGDFAGRCGRVGFGIGTGHGTRLRWPKAVTKPLR